MSYTFPKSEKLCGEQAVDHLYKNGKRFVVWPLRVTYLLVDQAPTQVLVWAPKSLFKKAVDRNHLRRLMREAYRQNKDIIGGEDIHYQLAFNYIDKEKQPYAIIEKAICKALKRISNTEQPKGE